MWKYILLVCFYVLSGNIVPTMGKKYIHKVYVHTGCEEQLKIDAVKKLKRNGLTLGDYVNACLRDLVSGKVTVRNIAKDIVLYKPARRAKV